MKARTVYEKYISSQPEQQRDSLARYAEQSAYESGFDKRQKAFWEFALSAAESHQLVADDPAVMTDYEIFDAIENGQTVAVLDGKIVDESTIGANDSYDCYRKRESGKTGLITRCVPNRGGAASHKIYGTTEIILEEC